MKFVCVKCPNFLKPIMRKICKVFKCGKGCDKNQCQMEK